MKRPIICIVAILLVALAASSFGSNKENKDGVAHAAVFNPSELQTVRDIREIVSVQEELRGAGELDRNGDGIGEYGSWPEIRGYGSFGNFRFRYLESGLFRNSSHEFRLQLYDRSGVDVTPSERGDEIDPVRAARDWCVIVVPLSGKGDHAFYANASGSILYAAWPDSEGERERVYDRRRDWDKFPEALELPKRVEDCYQYFRQDGGG